MRSKNNIVLFIVFFLAANSPAEIITSKMDQGPYLVMERAENGAKHWRLYVADALKKAEQLRKHLQALIGTTPGDRKLAETLSSNLNLDVWKIVKQTDQSKKSH